MFAIPMHLLSDLLAADELSISSDIAHFRFSENGKSFATAKPCSICDNGEAMSSIVYIK